MNSEKSLVTIRESVSSPSQKGHGARRSVTLELTPETKLFRGRTPIAATDLRPNDYVVARYSETPSGARALSLRVADVVAHAAPTTTPARAEFHERPGAEPPRR